MTSLPNHPYFGHDPAQKTFMGSYKRGALHHAWILAGTRGLGKAGFAHLAAHFLLNSGDSTADNVLAFQNDGTSQAAKLLTAGSHPDFRLLQRGGKTDKEEKKARENGLDSLEEHEKKRNITIDQVRKLQSLFATRPSISDHRVVIIDAIDDLERNAANALLKNLEEPPQDTVFLLVSHAPERLLPTIRSRCQILRFDPLNDQDMRAALRQFSPDLSDDELAALVAAGEGAPGQALQYVDAGLAELEKLAREIMQTGDGDNQIKNDLARKLSLKAATPRYQAFLGRAPSLIAQRAKTLEGEDQMKAIATWREARDLASMAIPKALDNQAVVVRLAALMGSLAHQDKAA